MSRSHQPAPTTHTIELRQVREINQRLAAPGHTTLTAEAIGVAGMATASSASFPVDMFGTALPASEVLRPAAPLGHLTAEGSPEFPYILGHFAGSLASSHRQSGACLVVELHSGALRRLSRRLGLRHCWGTDAASTGNIIR